MIEYYQIYIGSYSRLLKKHFHFQDIKRDSLHRILFMKLQEENFSGENRLQ